MSFRTVQQNSIDNRNTLSVPAGAQARGAGGGWIRNPSWLPMPAITSANEEVDMLVRINPESNFIAFIFNTSAGTYTVDWGDGTSGTFASAATAQKQYDFTTVALDGTNAPVTFQQSGSTVSRTSHGYPNGYPISFASITTTTGINATQTYYVVNATTNTFQVSATRGGTALTLTNDGTGIILPYKQAIIKVTPTTGGATLTTVNLQVKNTTTGLQAYAQPVMDLTISADATNITVTGVTVPMNLLERCIILRHRMTTQPPRFTGAPALQVVSLPFDGAAGPITNTSTMFQNCPSLQTAPFFNMANVTRSDFMFDNCRSLQTIPVYSMTNNANLTSMFANCTSLQTLSLLNINTSSATDMTRMFNGCTALQTLPLLDTSRVTNMTSMFENCTSLQTVPLFNTANTTNMSSMFNGCTSLQTVPLFNTANTTNMSFTLQNCRSLQSVPLLNTANAANLQGMFTGCTSLQAVPLFNTANTTTMNSMLSGCTSLQTIPAFNTAASTTNIRFMFNGCTALQTVSTFNAAASVDVAFTFGSCPSLSSIGGLTNLILSIDVSACKLSGPALNTIYTSLGRVGGGAGIVTFQGNPTNTVTIASHGYTGGESIIFSVITTTTGISAGTIYWVRNVTTNTFQLSATPTGAILTLTNNGTGTRAPATITVTNNWGTATDTPAIATAKGWTVTGS